MTRIWGRGLDVKEPSNDTSAAAAVVGSTSADSRAASPHGPPGGPLGQDELARLPGRLLENKYLVERVLGRGGVGVVVAAKHVDLQQRVAIKLLLPQALANQDSVERFAREARAAARIQNDHVVRVFDVGRLETGAPYMVMEYLDGTDLAEIIETRAPLPIVEAVDYVLQVCDALSDAHALGIIHRDLKPANIFVTQRAGAPPCVKVVDFGISKSMLSEQPITDEMAVMGSPGFMSPEQLWSTRDVDARADIWSLGAILYELLTAKRAYYVENLAHLFEVVSTQPPAPIRDVRPDVPPELEAIVLRCLSPNREQRYPSAAALAEALAKFGSPRSVPPPSAAAPAKPRPRWRHIGLAIAAAALLGAGLALVIPHRTRGSVHVEDQEAANAATNLEGAEPHAPERSFSPPVSPAPPTPQALPALEAAASATIATPPPRAEGARPAPKVDAKKRPPVPVPDRKSADGDEREFGGRK